MDTGADDEFLYGEGANYGNQNDDEQMPEYTPRAESDEHNGGFAQVGGFESSYAADERKIRQPDGDDIDGGDPHDRAVAVLRVYHMNEKAAPELLKMRQEVIDAISDVASIALMELEMASRKPWSDFLGRMQMLDSRRVLYIIHDLFRARMSKILSNLRYYVTTAEDRLSEAEKKFARRYIDRPINVLKLTDEHLGVLFVSKLDRLRARDGVRKKVKALDEPRMISKPKMHTHVFCRVVEDVGTKRFTTQSGGEESETLMTGETLVINYSAIRDEVERGSVRLVKARATHKAAPV
ncbi:unnamed protein product [Vitrella brassicaformis CCMP3155]|uniref:DNA replication complex GINS protein SLD5 n=1 Tax=Vitrella brassicaformis (strain CCMP3155) TaxID=1169540 RepID=A0A0G4ETI1_VITBC|nr:unnamed protein product [Vitrella brassicaformis CCMP3155]|eukprot:CEM01914.1 unnamed protein product [Vitrella brassicaformis CCMP3155]